MFIARLLLIIAAARLGSAAASFDDYSDIFSACDKAKGKEDPDED